MIKKSKNAKNEKNINKQKTSVSDQATAKGCLTLTLVILGAGALIYVISLFVSNNPFPEFPQFIRRAPDGFHIEWPFGKSAVSKAEGDGGADDGEIADDGDDAGDGEIADDGAEYDGDGVEYDGDGGNASDGEIADDSVGGNADDGVGANNDGVEYDGDGNAAGTARAGVDISSDSAEIGSASGTNADNSDPSLADYDGLLAKHTEMLMKVDAFQNGEISAAELRQLCDGYGSWFDRAIVRLNHSAAEAEREYRNILVAAAMSDQIAAAAIVKSLDEGDASMFDNPASDYSRNIGDAEDAYAYVLGLQGDNPAR